MKAQDMTVEQLARALAHVRDHMPSARDAFDEVSTRGYEAASMSALQELASAVARVPQAVLDADPDAGPTTGPPRHEERS